MGNKSNKVLTLTMLSGAAIGVIHVGNKIISETSQISETLKDRSHTYYHWRFGNIYYTKRGKGSPVLLIHNLFPGSSGYEWDKVEKEIAEKHTVYTIDLPGCGRSEKTGITYTNYIFVQMTNDFIRDVIKEKTTVIASGFSSSFVVMANINEENNFEKLILINPPAFSSLKQIPEDKTKLYKKIIELPVLGTFLYHITVSRENIKSMLMDKMYYNPFKVTENIIEAYYESAHKGGYYAKYLYASFTGKYINININKALAEAGNKTYIINGEKAKDQELIVNEYQKINSEIVKLAVPASAQLPHMEQPEEFLRQLFTIL